MKFISKICPILAVGVALIGLPPILRAAESSAVEPPRPGATLALESAIAEAIARNPALLVLEADVDAARGEIVTAKTRQNPELTVGSGLRRDRSAGQTELQLSLGYSQSFMFPGKRELLVALAERNVELRRLAIDGLRFQLAAAVRKAFYELLAAQSIVGLRQQQIESAKSFQIAASTRAAAGYTSDFEAVKSSVDVLNATKLLREAEGQIATARVELNTLMGREPTTPLEVTGTLDSTAPSQGQTALLARALAGNPSLRAQAMQAEIAGLNLRKARLANKPGYAIGPSLEYSKSEYIIGLSLTMELPSKNAGQGEILAATAEQRKALAESERLSREITGAVAMAAARLATARAQLALYSPEYLSQLKTVLTQAEQNYTQSGTALLIYLDAKRTYFDALADSYEALAQVASSRAELESAVGAPLETNLNPLNP